MRYCLALAALLLGSLSAAAQGIILEPSRIVTPRPPTRRIHRAPVRLIEHRVKITIDNQVARTDVIQIFHNPNPVGVEGIYLFPLPEGAAVADFTMSMGGKQITGELLNAQRASEIYRSIVTRRDDPGLLEYAGRGLIRARLFPIPPRGNTKVTLSFGQVLQPDAGLVELTYPMRSRAFGHGRMKTAGEIVVRDAAGIANLFSPSHKLDVVQKPDGSWIASFEENVAQASRDLRILYALGNKEFGVSLSTHRATGEDGYFVLLLSPRTSAKKVKVIPKDVIYVVDTSGSMGDRGGKKMKQAKRALNYALGRLNPGDRFNIISFATEARPYKQALVGVTDESIAAAIKHVDGLVATGGTAIHDAVVQALGVARAEGRVPIVIFLTDGEPTIGPVEPKTILAAAARANAAQARLFVFGVGYDVNTRLLEDLADANRGSGSYVTEGEDIEQKVSALVDRVSSPVLTDVKVTIDGIEVRDIYPRQVGDLFRGQQVVMVGRYRGDGAKAIRLSGKLGTEEVNYVYEASFPRTAERDYLPQLWAVRRVGFLMSEVRRNGPQKELVDEVRRLGTRYGIVTPYTSFLVVDERELARRRLLRLPPPGTPAARRAREADEETVAEATELESRMDDARNAFDKGLASGRGAVGGVVDVSRLKKAKSTSGLVDRGIRRIGGKTFRWTSGAWIDIDYAIRKLHDGPSVDVVYLSDEYLKLLADNKLARLLSVGKNVTLLYDGRLINVRAPK